MPSTLITVAPTGAETAKSDVPQLPTTLDELVAEARACEAAGAALIHVHVRDGDHRPTLDPARLRDTVAALREQTGLVVQLSTGGSVHDSFESRLAVLDAAPARARSPAARPTSATRSSSTRGRSWSSSTSWPGTGRSCRSSSSSSSVTCRRCAG